MLKITPVTESEITKILCPNCNERIPFIGLLKDSKVHGLTFRCRRCGKLWAIETE